MQRLPQPVKLYTLASIYRYATPQKGRYREHWQASVEAIGSDDPSIDAELIQLYDTLLARLGITEYRLELNSIGCRECRPAYLERLQGWLGENADRLDAETRAKMATSPLRVLDNISAKPASVREALGRRLRSATSSVTPVPSTSRPFAPTWTRSASTTSSFRRSCAVSTTTRARPGSSSAPSTARRAPSAAAGGTTISSRTSAAADAGGRLRRRHRASPARARACGCEGRGAGDRRLLRPRGRWPERGREPLARRAPRERRRCDTDYAGRSLKGQLTQAAAWAQRRW